MWHSVQLRNRTGWHLAKAQVWYQTSLSQVLCYQNLLHWSQQNQLAPGWHQPPWWKHHTRRTRPQLNRSLEKSRMVCHTLLSVRFQLRNGHNLTQLFSGAPEKGMYRKANSCPADYQALCLYLKLRINLGGGKKKKGSLFLPLLVIGFHKILRFFQKTWVKLL